MTLTESILVDEFGQDTVQRLKELMEEVVDKRAAKEMGDRIHSEAEAHSSPPSYVGTNDLVAHRLREVRLTIPQVEAALKELGTPGTRAEAYVWTAAKAYLAARHALDEK